MRSENSLQSIHGIKTFPNKQSLGEFIFNRNALKEILQKILQSRTK